MILRPPARAYQQTTKKTVFNKEITKIARGIFVSLYKQIITSKTAHIFKLTAKFSCTCVNSDYNFCNFSTCRRLRRGASRSGVCGQTKSHFCRWFLSFHIKNL